MNLPGEDLAPAALAIARVEYPSLDTAPYVALLDRMGEEAASRIGTGEIPFEESVRAFNEYFYDELGFTGNRDRYDDPRNSFLNEVLNRRTGIPISLAVVYLEVARRAGLRVSGVNFPGHFLLRAPMATQARHDDVLIVDPFHRGALLSELDCRELLRQHVGDAAAFDRTLLEPATRHQIVVRMLVNLKRLYVRMRSFPAGALHLRPPVDRRSRRQLPSCAIAACSRITCRTSPARCAISKPTCDSFPSTDRLTTPIPLPTEDEESEGGGSEHEQIWEHVKTLRKRVASFN